MKGTRLLVLTILTIILNSGGRGATLIAHYKFDDPENMRVDASGAEHTLEVGSGYGTPEYSASGKFDGASSFDGSTQGWIVNDNIYPAGSFSMAVWVYPTDSVTIVSLPATLSSGFGQLVGGNGKYYFVTYYDLYKFDQVIAPSGPVAGKWQHLAMTFEAISGPDSNGIYTGTIRGYIDGNLVGTTVDARYVSAANNDMQIGRRGTKQFFPGLIDDLRVYNGVLSENEIRRLVTPPKISLVAIGSL